jgi:hypothetical protein
VDVGGLPVRQPWWLLAARRSALLLGRMHGVAASPLPEPVHPAPLTIAPAMLAARRPALATGLRTRVGSGRGPIVASHRHMPMVSRAVDATPTVRPAEPAPVSYGRTGELPVLGGAPVAGPSGGFDPSGAVSQVPAPPSPVAPVPAAARMHPAPAWSSGSGMAALGGWSTGPAAIRPALVSRAPLIARTPVTAPASLAPLAGTAPFAGRAVPISRAVSISRAVPASTASGGPAPTGPGWAKTGGHGAAAHSGPGAAAHGTGPGARGTGPGSRMTGPGTGTGIGTTGPGAEARWRAAVAARPLESPRPFPTGLRPLVESLTGSAHRASYTTGPATRQALRAAGAVGASTGTVVHLPAAPSSGALLHVVAHELAHTRNPVSRPRFLLEVPHGSVDADERAALAIGRRVQAAGNQLGSMGAGIVGDLPVGGSGRIPDLAGAGRSAVDAVEERLPDVSLPGVRMPELPVPPDVRLPDVAGQAGATVTQAASALGNAAGAAGAALGGVDLDHLAELLEQRVLRQIERRGGRYAGMF